MINFHRDFDPDKNNRIIEKLQKLLDEVDQMSDTSMDDILDDWDANVDMDLAKIIDTIYNVLFVENYKTISLTVNKNSNNSLDLEVTKIS